MGPGGVLDAEFGLRTGVAAGSYHLVCDGVILRAVDVTFQLVWKQATTESVIGEVMQHFEPLPAGGFDAQPCDLDIVATAIDGFVSGDQLILRFRGANTTSQEAYIPNGDGDHAHGRIPNLTLP